MYSIQFHGLSGLVAPQFSTASAATAKRVAVDALKSGAAKRAEVRDPSGKLILELTQADLMH